VENVLQDETAAIKEKNNGAQHTKKKKPGRRGRSRPCANKMSFLGRLDGCRRKKMGGGTYEIPFAELCRKRGHTRKRMFGQGKSGPGGRRTDQSKKDLQTLGFWVFTKKTKNQKRGFSLGKNLPRHSQKNPGGGRSKVPLFSKSGKRDEVKKRHLHSEGNSQIERPKNGQRLAWTLNKKKEGHLKKKGRVQTGGLGQMRNKNGLDQPGFAG